LIERARSPIVASHDDPQQAEGSARGMLIEEIDGVPPALHPLAGALVEAGFLPGAMGFQARPAR
jgi:hypothetical protein